MYICPSTCRPSDRLKGVAAGSEPPGTAELQQEAMMPDPEVCSSNEEERQSYAAFIWIKVFLEWTQ